LNIVLASPAGAGSTTAQFDVTITIQAGCEVTGPSDLDFGTHSFIDSAITATTTFSIRCSNGTTGTIALNGGSGTSQSISTRTMETGANSINYNLVYGSGLSDDLGRRNDGLHRNSQWDRLGGNIDDLRTGSIPDRADTRSL